VTSQLHIVINGVKAGTDLAAVAAQIYTPEAALVVTPIGAFNSALVVSWGGTASLWGSAVLLMISSLQWPLTCQSHQSSKACQQSAYLSRDRAYRAAIPSLVQHAKQICEGHVELRLPVSWQCHCQ
jgi:ABC-type cobalamin transport system ATPase subunit